MCMSKDHRPPRADVVEVAIAIKVEQPGPFAAREEERFPPNSAKRTRRTVDATRDQLLGTLEGGAALISRHRGSLCRVTITWWAARKLMAAMPVGACFRRRSTKAQARVS